MTNSEQEKGKSEQKENLQGDSTKKTTQKPEGETKSVDLIKEIEKLKKENENLRGTQSATDKQLESLKRLEEGFKKIAGVTEEEDTNPLDAVTQRLGTLEASLNKAQAEKIVNDVVDNYKDDKGNKLTENKKLAIKKLVQVDSPDSEVITQKFKDALSVIELVDQDKPKSDTFKPEKSQSGGVSANDILEKLGVKY